MISKILLIGNLIVCGLLSPSAHGSYPSEITGGDASISGASGNKVNYPPNYQFPNSPERDSEKRFQALFLCKIDESFNSISEPLVLGYFHPGKKSEGSQIPEEIRFLTNIDNNFQIPIREIPQYLNSFTIQGAQDRPPLNCSGIPQSH